MVVVPSHAESEGLARRSRRLVLNWGLLAALAVSALAWLGVCTLLNGFFR